MNADTCDLFRAEYPSLSFFDIQDWYVRMEKEHPQQKHYNLDGVLAFLDPIKAPFSVLELGGWDGELAHDVLSRMPRITSWENHEIHPSLVGKCSDDRYSAPKMACHLWESDVDPADFDVLIASHILEHISETQLLRLRDFIDGMPVYVDMPREFSLHAGTTSFHVLDNHWEKVEEAFRDT